MSVQEEHHLRGGFEPYQRPSSRSVNVSKSSAIQSLRLSIPEILFAAAAGRSGDQPGNGPSRFSDHDLLARYHAREELGEVSLRAMNIYRFRHATTLAAFPD
jgi:hypothetical protein